MQRDLACHELWTESLERSRARRGGPARASRAHVARPAVELPGPPVPRDLLDTEVWERSQWRSRTRREAAERGLDMPLPSARKISIAALLALGGAPAVGGAAKAASHLLSGGTHPETAEVHLHPAAARRQSRSTPTTAHTAPARPSIAVAAPAPRAHPPAAPQQPVTTGADAGGTQTATVRRKQPAASAATTGHSHHAGARLTVALRPRPRGGGVAALQQALGVPADATFGSQTQKALVRFQRAHGLTADGVAGPDTRTALDLGPGPALKRVRRHRSHRSAGRRTTTHHHRRRGGGVTALQRALGLPADGVFGPATERALKRFQRAHGLTADGVAGPQTRRALRIGPGAPLHRRHRRHASRGRSHHWSGGGSSAVVQRVIAAANRIATMPYRYGGGHGSFTDSGYDCSGSVSYALHGGGLLSSPLDSTGFMSYGRPGPGRHITIYANSGHAWMTIDGRRFDTSSRSQSGSRWGGPRSSAGYVVRHPAGY